jgi:glucosylceramidase
VGLEVSAFRNRDGSTAMVVLNSAHSAQEATFSLRGLTAAQVTPYLTDTSHDLSPQASVPVKTGAFTATLPARSLVSYEIRP